MKKIIQLSFGLLLLTGQCDGTKHVIGYQEGAGLFYNFLGVVNNLIWSKKNSKEPVVYWGPISLYYQKKGYKGKKNVWEYYFEPVSSATLEGNEKFWNSNATPDGAIISPTTITNCTEYEHHEKRKAAYALIREHIRLRPYLAQKIESFYQEYMSGKKTIGIHLRGTDKRIEIVPVNVPNMLNDANKFAEEFPGCQFLIATDEERLLQLAKSVLKGPIIHYDAQMSKNDKPIHFHGKNKAKLGEDVIVEAYLLSRCDLFLHTCSSVSTAVLFLNPDLEHKFYKAE